MSKHKETPEEVVEEKKTKKKKVDKTRQNYMVAILLISALLVGSIFVDVADLIRGDGISKKRLADKDLFEYAGKTWVSYPDPAIEVVIVNDKSCEECKVDSAVLGLKSAIPTVVPREIDIKSDEGKKLLAKTESKMYPVFVFENKIEKVEVFPKIENVLTKKDAMYILDASVLGVNGKYIETPAFASKNQEVLGNPEAKISIIEFSDFQCPYCKVFYDSLNKITSDPMYKDKVKVAFKHLPLSFHNKANDASLAASCAGQQNKFWPMYDMLYTKQEDWQNATDNAKFKGYAAQLKLDAAKFGTCMDKAETQADIEADKEVAKQYGISGTPAIFINDEFVSGAIKYEDLKSKIDALLAK